MHKLSIVKQTIKNVLVNVAADKVKTFLTCLGIMFGTGALICMMTNFKIEDQIKAEDAKAEGSYYIDISVTDEHIRFSDENIDHIRQISHVIGLTPKISVNGSVRNGRKNMKDATITGVSDEYLSVGECFEILSGRGISQAEVKNSAKVCIINGTVAEKLFGDADPIGQQISINGFSFKVIGLSHKKNEGSWSKEIFIPYTTAEVISGNTISELLIFPDTAPNSEAVNSEVEEYVQNLTKTSDSIWNYFFYWDTTQEDRMKHIQQYIVAFLTMLIGGIGIMNMMHVMVTERTVEIGLRKALGATPARIQVQFVAEAVIISLLGGTGGIVLGIIGSVIICVARGRKFTLNPISFIISILFSTAVGVVFGWLPAKSASSLNAIDALKGE